MEKKIFEAQEAQKGEHENMRKTKIVCTLGPASSEDDIMRQMLLAGLDSIRDVIAFPKVQNASELMTACPSVVDQKQLDELHLAVVPEEAE